MVHTVSFKIRVPRVIVLMLFDRMPKKEVKFTRANIFERDKNTCQYCGKVFDRRDLNLDHVIPRDKGGTTTWENIVCSCIPCNTKKGNRLPHQVAHASDQEAGAPEVAAVRAHHLRQPASTIAGGTSSTSLTGTSSWGTEERQRNQAPNLVQS